MKHPRQRSEKHLKFVRALPCLVCGDDVHVEAAHIRYPDSRFAKYSPGVGEKPDDKWAVPLCGKCHREQHEQNERAFWQIRDIDPVELAARIWINTGDYDAALVVIQHASELHAL